MYWTCIQNFKVIHWLEVKIKLFKWCIYILTFYCKKGNNFFKTFFLYWTKKKNYWSIKPCSIKKKVKDISRNFMGNMKRSFPWLFLNYEKFIPEPTNICKMVHIFITIKKNELKNKMYATWIQNFKVIDCILVEIWCF